MTHYEELGLTVSASAEDIRKAHRTLSRLLHPDQQTDDALRRAAELQMRRVNAIVDVLLDPAQRRRYDESLRPAPAPAPVPDPCRDVSPFSVLKLIGVVATAIAVTLIAIWLLAGDFIHWNGAAARQPAMAAESRASVSVPPPPPVTIRVPAPLILQAQQPLQETALLNPAPMRKRLAANAPRFLPDMLPLSTAYTPPGMPLPEPSTETWRPPPPPSFAGLWLLPLPRKTEGSREHAPQYVQINIHRGQNDAIYGDYAARYEAPDRPVSPEVAFTFEGSAAGSSAVLDWKAPDGSRGNIELKLLTSHTMQVTWQATGLGSTLAIAGGAAVVMRTAN